MSTYMSHEIRQCQGPLPIQKETLMRYRTQAGHYWDKRWYMWFAEQPRSRHGLVEPQVRTFVFWWCILHR